MSGNKDRQSSETNVANNKFNAQRNKINIKLILLSEILANGDRLN